MKSPVPSRLLLLAVLLAGPATGFAQVNSIFKQAIYTQTSAAGASPSSGPVYPYEFSVSASAAGSATPPGMAAQALVANPDSQDYELQAFYAGKAAMTAAYPDGTYTFAQTGGSTLGVAVTGDLFPATAPQIVGGTWQNGALLLDPTKANTLTVSTFSGYGTYPNGSYLQASLQSQNGIDGVNLKQQTATIAVAGITQASQPFTTIPIPANTLKAGGIYQFTLNFSAITYLNTGSTVTVGGYQNFLYCYVIAQSGTGPSITQQPANVTSPLGSTALINAGANYGANNNNNGSGNNGNQFIWYFNGGPLPDNPAKYLYGTTGTGVGNASLSIKNLTAADAGSYTVALYAPTGYTVSQAATLTIGAVPPPAIGSQPSSVTMAPGSTTVMSVAATGAPLSYQWYLNNNPINGATGSRYVLVAGNATAGTYTCKVTNAGGTVTSAGGTVTLASGTAATTGAGRLVNLSVNANIGSGLTLGFVSGGPGTSGQEPLLIRAAGPALKAFGVSGTLADPLLTLFNTQSVAVATNSGWGSNQVAIAAADSLTGAFPLTDPASLDAALLTSLSGLNSVGVTGKSGDTGRALAEVYDATPTYTTASPRLINLSCRANVAPADTLTAGFVITGSTAKTVLIRATGPALTTYGVTGVMPDPTLTLNATSGNSQGVIATNAGWGGDPQINNVGGAVGAFPLTNNSSLDSVILITLAPGNYTASVTSASGGGGAALVEVYEIF